MAKYLRINGNNQEQAASVQTSAGAGDADKIVSLNSSGILDSTVVNSTVTSAGAGSAGKLAALDSSGRLDNTMMPSGIGADVFTATASEALAANDLVNQATDGTVRKADASNGRDVSGFVKAAVSNGAAATVYKEGSLTGLSGLTPGARYFLSATTAGSRTATAPTTPGQLWQPIGKAVSATEIDYEPELPITL